MRKHVLGLGIFALVALAPAQVEAQATIGPTIAWHDNFDIGFGATVGFPVDELYPGIRFMGDFLWFLPGDVTGFSQTYWEINGNLTYDFPLEETTAVPFVLAGLSVSRYSADIPGSSSSSNVALNIGGGVSFDAGSVRPSVGGRFELKDGSAFVFFATLPFEMGQ